MNEWMNWMLNELRMLRVYKIQENIAFSWLNKRVLAHQRPIGGYRQILNFF